MIRNTVRLSVVEQAGLAGACELCAARGDLPVAVVSVDHTRGGQVRFAACLRCTRAARRLAAALGSSGPGGAVEVVGDALRAATAPPAKQITVTTTVASAELLLEPGLHIRDEDGRTYDIRVYGAPRPSGTWIGWIEFASTDSDLVLSTGRETTQSNREGVAYWASGLEPTYFQGAFARAR